MQEYKFGLGSELLQDFESSNTSYTDQPTKEALCIAFDGSYTHSPKKDVVETAVASLWCHSDELLCKKASQKYLLVLSCFSFAYGELPRMESIAAAVDFADPVLEANGKVKSLILRNDHTNSMTALGLNSARNYYCQVILLSFGTKHGKNFVILSDLCPSH